MFGCSKAQQSKQSSHHNLKNKSVSYRSCGYNSVHRMLVFQCEAMGFISRHTESDAIA